MLARGRPMLGSARRQPRQLRGLASQYLLTPDCVLRKSRASVGEVRAAAYYRRGPREQVEGVLPPAARHEAADLP